MDKIICLGKNYLEHAKELGDAVPEKPVIFLKPPSVLKTVKNGETLRISLPKNHGSVHHECEIVCRITSKGRVEAVTLGLDMTLRDLQSGLKKNGQPWTVAKVFDGSAVIGPWIPLETFQEWESTSFSFSLDGKLRQKGKGSEMSMKVEEALPYIASYFPLCEGDLLFTGTPAGVGPVASGQTAHLQWANLAYSVTWE